MMTKNEPKNQIYVFLVVRLVGTGVIEYDFSTMVVDFLCINVFHLAGELGLALVTFRTNFI